MRILVTGGRNYSDIATVREVLAKYKDTDAVIVHGDARGADTLCDRVAKELNLSTEPHPAAWDKYGKAAGMIRNREMVKSDIDLCIAFPGGRGTADCVRKAQDQGIKTISVYQEGRF